MISKQKGATPKYISVYGVFILFFVLIVPFLGCDLIQQLVPPDRPDSAAPVKIGFIYSPPDPGTTRNGAELAVALANEAGGISGVPIELLIMDDKREPSIGVQQCKETN